MLSTSGLLGSTLRGQQFFSGPHVYQGTLGGNCFLQAAGEAEGYRTTCEKHLAEKYPWITDNEAVCPECGVKDTIMLLIAFHLNDWHQWSLTRIAEQVAAWEREFGIADAQEEELVTAATT